MRRSWAGRGTDGLEEKALASGASKLYIRDLREEFLTDFVYPTMRAGAVYEREYLLGTSFARPLIAKHLVAIAAQENADAVAHGCTGKGNDQVRFEVSTMALNPKLKTIAPWREWDIRSREDALAYAEEFRVPVSHTEKDIYSRDRNIFHLSHEGGLLENPWNEPESPMYQLTSEPECAPDEAEYIEIGFAKGNPVSLNGDAMGAVELFTTLNALGGKHGIGRSDIVENRLVGMKSRGVYETPAGTILHRAHQLLESICLDKHTMQYKDIIAAKYAELVYNGMWYSKLRQALRWFRRCHPRDVTGTARLKLYKAILSSPGAEAPTASIVKITPRSAKKMSTISKTRKASSSFLACRSRSKRCCKRGRRATEHASPDYSKFKRD